MAYTEVDQASNGDELKDALTPKVVTRASESNVILIVVGGEIMPKH